MKRVAVVEDNADNRLLLRAMIGERYEITDSRTLFEDETHGSSQQPAPLSITAA